MKDMEDDDFLFADLEDSILSGDFDEYTLSDYENLIRKRQTRNNINKFVNFLNNELINYGVSTDDINDLVDKLNKTINV